MKRQCLALLAVASVVAGAAGCFKDPVSSLRNGPSVLSLDQNAVYLLTGDSTTVTGYLKDAGGNTLPATGAEWKSLDPTIAVVRNDTTQVIPDNAFTRGVIRGVITTGGITHVTVSTRGVTDTIRVIVVPPALPASQVSLVGASRPDTVIIPAQAGPPAVPPDTVRYTAADTVVLDGTGFLNFDTSDVSAYSTGLIGAVTGYVTAKTPTKISIVFTQGASGHIIVKHVQLATGNASVGTQPLDSLVLADSLLLSRMRYRGAVTQVGDTVMLAHTNGVSFLPGTVVNFGANTGYLFDTAGKVLAKANYTGYMTLDNVPLGTTVLDHITSVAPVTVAASAFKFPGGINQVGDTVNVVGTSLVKVDSQVTVSIGSGTATVLSRGGNSVRVLWTGPTYTGPITVNDPGFGITRVASLATGASYTVNQAKFLGPVAVVGDTMTVSAPTGVTFDKTTSVSFGGGAGIVLSYTDTTMRVLSPVAYTGAVAVTNALLGTLRIPAMTTTGSFTIGAAQFPSANVSVGAGNLGDTIVVTAPTGYSFSTSGSVSKVLAGNLAINTSDTSWTLHLTADTILAMAKRGGGGPVRVTNVVIPGGVVVPYLTTPTNFPIDSIVSDLPEATSQASANVLTIPGSGTAMTYGAVPAQGTVYWQFTTTTGTTAAGELAWFGSGCPYGIYGYCANTAANSTAYTEDLDFLICDFGNACDDYGNDLAGNAAATISQPEKFDSVALPPGHYALGVLGFNVDYTIVYRLTLTLQ